MRILVVGNERKAESVMLQLSVAGHAAGYVLDMLTAATIVGECPYDLVLLVDCERLEETDLDAEDLKNAALAGPSTVAPYVFVLWDGVCGFERAGDYGLAAIDILLEDFSVKQCEQAYQYARHNGI